MVSIWNDFIGKCDSNEQEKTAELDQIWTFGFIGSCWCQYRKSFLNKTLLFFFLQFKQIIECGLFLTELAIRFFLSSEAVFRCHLRKPDICLLGVLADTYYSHFMCRRSCKFQTLIKVCYEIIIPLFWTMVLLNCLHCNGSLLKYCFETNLFLFI